MADDPRSDEERSGRVPPVLEAAAAWSWRLLVVGAVVVAVVALLGRIKFVFIPVFAALLLTTVLTPIARWLARRGLPALLATWITFFGFLGLLVAVVAAIAPAVVDEFDDLDATVEDAIDEIEDWLITGPAHLDAETVADWRDRVGEAIDDILAADGNVASGAVLVGEAVTGVLITLVLTFFFVKDGERFQRAVLAEIPARHHARVRALGTSAWRTLGGYLRGAALLGIVEALIIGGTVAVVGAGLAVPVATITFLAAFIPFVGAFVAGIVAVLVALVSGGASAAAVVAVVALVVQQFDNELLAPLIYGRALSIHPVIIVLTVATGATLGGLTGAFLAVPLTAVVINGVAALRRVDAPSP